MDAFQGREKDDIFPVFDLETGGVQNTHDRISQGSGIVANVALTRAKYELWIVGHAPITKRHPISCVVELRQENGFCRDGTLGWV